MYDSNDVAARIRNLAKERKVSMKQLLADVGLGFNTMTAYRTSMPKADNLARIADYLDCSVDYLLGRTDIPEVYRHEQLHAPDGRSGFLLSTQKSLSPQEREQVEQELQRALLQPAAPLPDSPLAQYVRQVVDQALNEREQGEKG